MLNDTWLIWMLLISFWIAEFSLSNSPYFLSSSHLFLPAYLFTNTHTHTPHTQYTSSIYTHVCMYLHIDVCIYKETYIDILNVFL
jgi:uncharacterized membrane protein YiaA